MVPSDRARWDARHAASADTPLEPHGRLQSLDLPSTGPALDLACGRGRIALSLARRGLRVLAVDVSPVGLEVAAGHARRAGVALRTQAWDGTSDPLPAGPFAVITCFWYWQPELWPLLPDRLQPGGWLVMEFPHRESVGRYGVPSARFLATETDLAPCTKGLDVRMLERVESEGRVLLRLAAQRPPRAL